MSTRSSCRIASRKNLTLRPIVASRESGSSASPVLWHLAGAGIVNLTTACTVWYHRLHDNNIILAHVYGLPLPCRDYQSRGVALVSILPQLSRRGRAAGSARDRPHI